MELLIGIATYKRPEKLVRLLKSLNNQTYKDFNIHIVFDNNDKNSVEILNKFITNNDVYHFGISIQKEHRFVIGAWNRCVQEVFMKNNNNYFCGLCDDVELEPNALQIIVNRHKDHFHDTDGVLGFNQKCPGHPEYTFKWFGQTLMGRKFIERYKEGNYQICCPDYKHFYQDEEMYNYAHSLNKFFCCEEAVLNHYHPGFVKEEIDETHHVIRSGKASPKDHDCLMTVKREDAGYLWGRDFNLIGENNE